MTFPRTYIKCSFFLLVTLLSCGGAPEDQLELPNDDYQVQFNVTDPLVVGIVDFKASRDTLLLSDLEKRISRLRDLAPDLMNDPAQSQKMRKEILDNFLQNHVIRQEAETRKIEVDEELVASELYAFKSRFADEDAYKSELQSMGLSEEEFKLDTKDRAKQRLLMEVFRNEVEKPNEQSIDSYIVQQQESRRLAHILFSFDRASNNEDLTALKGLAQAVLDSLRGGADFSQMAKRHSDDGSSRQGGDLDFVERGQMVEAFEEAAFNLQNNGDITEDLVQTVFGLHIIKLLSQKTNPPMDREVASERLFNDKRHEAVNEQIRLLKSEAILQLNPEHISRELFRQ